MPALSVAVRNVTKAYGPVRALAGVSCQIAAGRTTLIRGPNGSGKSTLLALIGTIARPTSGEIAHGDPPRGRRGVRETLGWVSHESLCYPDLTGRQNVELVARFYGVDPVAAVERAVARFDLGPFLDRGVRTYSRGQRQRLALARALVHDPLLVLLDEPTTGLDDQAVERLADTLREESSRGATVVVVTHDASFGEHLGADVIALERGRRVPVAQA